MKWLPTHTRNSLTKRSKMLRFLTPAVVLVVGATLLGGSSASASTSRVTGTNAGSLTIPSSSLPVRPTITPVMSCAALLQQDFSQIPAAPTSLTSARLVGTGASQDCEVYGYIAPQTEFELLLPTTTYEGRYLQTGCGGNCGTVSIGVSPEADTAVALTANTFAVSTNDEGHTATGPWDVWGAPGIQNPLRVQFGYLADHLNAVVAKAIIRTFYGVGPAYSYFDGYSDGGRAAVQEAQKYPNDFNGIIAGAPAIEIQDALVFFDFAAQHLLNPDGSQIFDTTALNTLHTAAVAACDSSTGFSDNQVDDPRLCHWNPSSIECTATVTTNCLTSQQVAAAQAMYIGPTTANGKYMWPGGQSYGSELAWPSFAAAGVFLAGDNLRFLAFAQDPPPSYTWKDFTFTTQTWRALQAMGAIYDSNNNNHPDLTAFERAGGKLIVWASWQDEAGGAYSIPDWYQQVARKAGGLANAMRFARVFMLPAGSHFQAASGAIYNVNVLPSLVSWVENGNAPHELVAWQTDSTGAITRTYPSFPLPADPKYDGHGSINDAANYQPFVPDVSLHFRWLGDNTSSSLPYPGWPFVPPAGD